MESHIGLIGLAVMGSNLARNIADKKYRITVYNRTTSVTEQFMREFGNKFLVGANNLKDFVASLERPRKIIIMVKAGTAVDTVIAELSPLLSAGDIIVDCGNSFYRDTARRFTELQAKGIHYIGSGVSGGEVGALLGPSLMSGGARAAYRAIEPIWKKIAAKDYASSASPSG
jgi:6-phosphogluconate dehydrogenase